MQHRNYSRSVAQAAYCLCNNYIYIYTHKQRIVCVITIYIYIHKQRIVCAFVRLLITLALLNKRAAEEVPCHTRRCVAVWQPLPMGRLSTCALCTSAYHNQYLQFFFTIIQEEQNPSLKHWRTKQPKTSKYSFLHLLWNNSLLVYISLTNISLRELGKRLLQVCSA